MFDYTLRSCFVEREHASTDAIGDNTVEENLNTGELKVISDEDVDIHNLCILMLSTFDPILTTKDTTVSHEAKTYNGVFSALGLYATNITDSKSLGVKLSQLDTWGKSEGIIALWMYPKSLVQLADGESWEDGTLTHKVSGATSLFKDVTRNTKTSDSYTPKNNKLLTYPFNFIYVTNNMGGAGVFRYERFGDPSTCNFKIMGALTPEGCVKMYPLNYNGIQHNFEEGLTLSGYPTCAWNQDVYKLWLAQNQNQHNLTSLTSALTIAGGSASVVGGALTGNAAMVGAGVGMVSHGASTVASLNAQKKDMAIQPPQAKGQHSASVNVSASFQTFTVQKKSVSDEYARIIDDYFTMYGYQTNRVKVPARRVRENFTYTKTVNCHVTGNLCTEDLLKIQSIYDNGITFWVNGDSIGNYSLSNPCKAW